MDYLIQPIFNCFSGDTKFVTSKGVRTFNSFHSGEITEIIDKDGIWRKATVKKYQKEKLQTITLTSGRTVKKIRASYNHRWIKRDGTVTDNVEIGDRLFLLKETEEKEIDNDMFCLGFIIGDGSDTQNGLQVRLCGDKIKYLDRFKNSGFVETHTTKNNDVFLYKNGTPLKQSFLDNKMWKILNSTQLYSLVQGYKSADGCKDRNMFYTADERVLEMILEIAPICGYHILTYKKEIRDTNYKKNCTLYSISYITNQNNNRNWIVKDINRSDSHLYDLWCVEEPITKSFTLDGGVVTGNCCLINIEDMLGNGTVINGKMIEKPKSFKVACNVMTQIIAQVASNQYGGQSINKVDTILAPYAKASYLKYYKTELENQIEENPNTKMEVLEKRAEKRADKLMRAEIVDGVQTIQYQINTLMTTNGQSPFVTLLMHFEPGFKYEYEASLIQEEILKQRYKGIKNEYGVYITPAFPKLIYVLDEHNIYPHSKYYYLTELSAKCTARRMYPDYISAKNMKKHYEGNVFAPMGCRAFLSPYKELNGEYKFDGRFNIGVCTINLPQVALKSKGNMEEFWKILDKRLEMCKEVGLIRYKLLDKVKSDSSPIHWQHGAIARLKPGESISKFLTGGYATVTLGYVGIYETVKCMLGVSNTDVKGEEFALEIMDYMNKKITEWKKDTNLGFALYGTPGESTLGRLCEIDRENFGEIDGVTDRGYYTNSFHVNVREEISAFSKLQFEAKFQNLSKGGCISYIEIPNLENNLKAILDVIRYMYDNITYAEFNTKSDHCSECGFNGEIILDESNEWTCPQCNCKDRNKLTVVRRTCGLNN